MSGIVSSKLRRLRDLMSKHRIDAYIVPSADAHQSEYTAAHDKRRDFLSHFTGSAGTALVTLENAYLWTDGRYFLQAENELDPQYWKLMRVGQDLSIPAWLAKSEEWKSKSRIGVDPILYSVNEYQSLQSELSKSGLKHEIVSVASNLVDEIWDDRPPAPNGPIIALGKEFSGADIIEKVQLIREEMKKENCTYLVLTALDEIAWLMNLRGGDIAYNPVFMSYLLLSQDQVILYVDSSKFTEGVQQHLGSNVTVKPYSQFIVDLQSTFSSATELNGFIWLDPTSCSYGVYEKLPVQKLFTKTSPVKSAKAIKNKTELEGFTNSHVRDAVALVKFFAWLEDSLNKGDTTITEVSAADKLEAFRREQQHFVSLSFNSISGFGPNGAIIHYAPVAETCAVITKDNMYLIDSGAQYKDGTTDVTRTLHFGTPTSHQKDCYTRVLKGHIALDSIVFPEGTTGYKLDIIARLPLWQIGLDYNHGTGHGVGHFLNVHEGPHGIGARSKTTDDFPLQEHMIVTNEPGYYESGNFGIRIENICVVVEKKTPNNFLNKKFFGLQSVTVTPIQTKLIDASLLTDSELAWINNYNARCRAALQSSLASDPLAHKWLIDNTQPLNK